MKHVQKICTEHDSAQQDILKANIASIYQDMSVLCAGMKVEKDVQEIQKQSAFPSRFSKPPSNQVIFADRAQGVVKKLYDAIESNKRAKRPISD